MNVEEICSAAQNVLEAVEPVNSAAYESLLYLADESKRNSFLSTKNVDLPGLDEFAKAKEAISTEFQTALDTVKDVPITLKTSREGAQGAMEEFHAALTNRALHRENGPHHLSELAKMVQSSLRPEMARFVAELTKYMDSMKTDDVNRHRVVVDEAINDIETINSTINLIAVNASIEAALAGQAGRGFAIIAEEIQTLSQKSKRIVDEIRSSLR